MTCTFCHYPRPPLQTEVFTQAGKQDFLSLHICPDCNTPRPLLPQETYFTVFLSPMRFHQNPMILETRFYEASRILHPDRFMAASPDVQQLSLKRMSFVNQAYKTLKNPSLLRDYILLQAGITPPSTSESIPMEIAEHWFELQELLDSPKNHVEFDAFRNELKAYQSRLEQKITALEESYDTHPSKQTLETFAQHIQTGRYLSSLERDLEKALGRIPPYASTH